MLKQYWKELTILVLVLISYAQWKNPRTEQVEVQVEKIVERIVEVEKVVVKYVDRVVTKTVTKPDGTIIQINKEERSRSKEEVKSKEKEETEISRVSVSKPALSRYSLSVHTSQLSYPTTILVGARIGDLPVFVEGGVLTFTKNPTLSFGLRLEF